MGGAPWLTGSTWPKRDARVTEGDALLVCGYEDEAKCARIQLEGAISMREFEARAVSLPQDREIIFYCA